MSVPDDGSCQGRLNCSDIEECKRYATVGAPREMCECKAGTTRAFTHQGIRIVHALEFDEEEMRPPCVEPSQIGSFRQNTEIRATQVLVLSDNSGGSRVSQTGEGSQPIIWPIFHKNWIKMRTIKRKGETSVPKSATGP